MSKVLLSGNEAIARGAYEAGATVATAYPGTPSTEILENVSKFKDEVYCEWAPNEKVAMEVAIGACFGGSRSLVAMKHVGLNVAADPFMTLSYTGVKGGLVVVSADDPSMHSSQNEQDNRHFARFAKVPMLEPSDSEEAREFVKHAFEISEKFDTPVLFRVTTRISHSKTVATLGEREQVQSLEEFEKDPEKFVMVPGNARKRHVVVEDRMKQLEEFSNQTELNKIEWGDSKIGVITGGISYHYVKEALPQASILKLGFSYPLPKKVIEEFSAKVDKLYAVEELDPFLEEQIKAMGIEIIGKEELPMIYELNQKILKENLVGEKPEQVSYPDVDLPPRPPALCPGCPHRGVFYTLNKLNLAVMGDIGCYTLGVVPPLSAIDTTVCMGASVSMTFGAELALKGEGKDKLIGVIGDSTFIHTGITGLIDIVYNKGASTIMVLDNRTTGMTGHQENPGTGRTLMGESTKTLDVEEISKAVGVSNDNVRTVDAYNLDEVEQAVKEELAKDEPSIIITKNPCVLIDKDSRWEGLTIDSEKCKACGMCYKVGCSAVYKGEDGKAKIDSTFCTGCGVCQQVCKFDAIVKAGDLNE
ncbi:indolepyruvate ferredoxin oxidoreductase subunit alpha [Natranaerobius thermophilus]|uniref:Indolepyruvate oxidoreductase subunit IorA n=1 Tax=Natranaerobius thermophilus (strain ATCC BAA-1301 / DSM 18059 / JW/NM-WN-LF) TaxID=457570 RepID=B2A2E6_NATTJ|nr:indolepyruvate ferredoxin oxidoreductase subunit alpha [Natranaerobius thermophilus]ACB86252.1 indolepyruvate ferredoxin oxidoreductase, alpha subunit [Natranaerobius thermophilus JW/NM-WN-LF]